MIRTQINYHTCDTRMITRNATLRSPSVLIIERNYTIAIENRNCILAQLTVLSPTATLALPLCDS